MNEEWTSHLVALEAVLSSRISSGKRQREDGGHGQALSGTPAPPELPRELSAWGEGRGITVPGGNLL